MSTAEGPNHNSPVVVAAHQVQNCPRAETGAMPAVAAQAGATALVSSLRITRRANEMATSIAAF